MLKRFLLNILSSFVGTCIAVGLIVMSVFLLFVGIAGSISLSSTRSMESVKSRSILEIKLDGEITERESSMEPSLMSVIQGDINAPQTLDVIVESVKEAAVNENIVAIYLNCGYPAAGAATLDAIRHALLDFKKETGGKKKIIAYGDQLTQAAYFVASVADEIHLNPAGELSLSGLSATNPYFKGLLDKLGVQFQVVKVGTFKSAVEPYILYEMSAPARAQLDTLLNVNWAYIRGAIASCRSGVSPESVDSFINKDHVAFEKANFALKHGLVDSLTYGRNIKRRLASLSGREVEKLNIIKPSTLVSQTPWSDSYSAKNQIAVLFACGEIADGNSNQINYEDLVPVIVELADNENVKGLVLRVNSPGGSVFGSDQIGEALDYFKSKGKVLSVSMGDYAASGGYWISCNADRIFAEPLTITGSIGIFGLLPNFKGTLDKLGVNMETVSTNPQSIVMTGFKPLDEQQLAVMQKFVDRGYDDFTSRVAKGRKMSKQKVLSIAEGRVWAAPSALKIGLVDSLAYLQDAIDWTASKAKVSDNYNIVSYPKVEPNFWSLMRSGTITMAELKSALNQDKESTLRKYLLQRILSRNKVQARMPEFKVTL
jgi:protease-4